MIFNNFKKSKCEQIYEFIIITLHLMIIKTKY